MYAEKDFTFRLNGGQSYDHKGKIWRVISGMYHALHPKTYEIDSFWHINVANVQTGHQTILELGRSSTNVPIKIFTIKELLKLAR